MKRNPRKVSFFSLVLLNPLPPAPPSLSLFKTKLPQHQITLTHNPQLKWTKSFRKAAGKELVVDTTLTFSARRNVPVRYNRDLVSTTLKAMQRVSEIRAKRERVFYKNRMAGNKERQRVADRKLVEENGHLLPRVRGSETEKMREEEVEEEEGMREVVEEVVQQEEEEEVRERERVEEEKVKASQKKKKREGKVRQRLLVGGGVEHEMDVD